MKLKMFYCDIANYGDKLNEDIFIKYLNTRIKSKSIKNAVVIGIGSLLDMCLADSNKKIMKKPIKIFSTGFGFDEGKFFHNKNIIIPEKFKRDIKCYALRGYYTKSRVEKILNKKIEVAMGDGGLLASELIDTKGIIKKYDLGIVPHFADKDNEIFEKIQKHYKNSCILDVQKAPKDFLNDLVMCKTVVSTAMHPLIACDSFGIPNIWGRISELTTSKYKFNDYYSVFGKEKEPLNLLEFDYMNNNLIDIINEQYDIDYSDVVRIKKT